ncbi:hypothetical protein PPYR_03069 [Photinus pyralis]|uniref:Galectin n=1 Tax=Photinus pyralis TaxID=7054 RepID=A0A1Y1MAY5_PHOPY|nr:galectin-7-like [Photinus pyralis]KAB0791269.1 hypothetical protein PPYR_03069 [Photinus pyralis]
MELARQTSIPTIIPIGNNFTPGKGIKIRCAVPQGSSRFTVTLYCGSDVRVQTDAALHVVFNLSNNNTTFNWKERDSWGKECTVPGIPFDYGENFEILILCDQFHYKIFINGRPYSDFPQTVNYSLVTFLAIEGGVGVEQILFENFQVFIPSYSLPGNVTCASNDPTIPLNFSRCDWENAQRSKKKLYGIYIFIAFAALLIVLCGIFFPRMLGKHEYDYD